MAYPYDDDSILGGGYLVGDVWVEQINDKWFCGKCVDTDRPDAKILIWFRCTHCVANC